MTKNQPSYEATPNNSRYIPFTQQSSCCVPTCIQMIMYRNDIPLIPSEEIGYHLGLTVAPQDERLFYRARVSEQPPQASGYGTQINNPDYEPNRALFKLGIPLQFSFQPASSFKNADELLAALADIERQDADALLCFNYGAAEGAFRPGSGHVVVFDRLIDGEPRIVDAYWGQPKWRIIKPDLLFDAVQQHGDGNSGGIWHFTRITS